MPELRPSTCACGTPLVSINQQGRRKEKCDECQRVARLARKRERAKERKAAGNAVDQPKGLLMETLHLLAPFLLILVLGLAALGAIFGHGGDG